MTPPTMALLDRAPGPDRLLRHPTLTPAEGTAHYAQLRAAVRRAGILDRDYRYYTLAMGGTGLGVAVSLVYLIRLPLSAPLVLWALVFAVSAVQVCGLIHDAGKR